MTRNPIIPFFVIMFLGICLAVGLSWKGIGDSKDLVAEEKGGGAVTAEFSAEGLAKSSCTGCHGANFEGSVGPKLAGAGLSPDVVKEVLSKGKGAMPPNLVPAEHIEEMAKYISELK